MAPPADPEPAAPGIYRESPSAAGGGPTIDPTCRLFRQAFPVEQTLWPGKTVIHLDTLRPPDDVQRFG